MILAWVGIVAVACSDKPHAARFYHVGGLDISHYQGLVDWGEVDREEHDFVFIKATEGGTLRDRAFLYNWTEAGKLGLRRGAYHYFRPDTPVDAQTRLFFQTVDLRPGDLPPVLDVEDAGGLSSAQLVALVREWADLIELRYEVKPIIYTGQNFYNRYLAGQINEFPLWLARYDDEEPVTVCGRAFQFWQYSDRGRSRGIEGRVDQNIFTGPRRELAALCIPFPDELTAPAPSGKKPAPISNRPVDSVDWTGVDDLANFGYK